MTGRLDRLRDHCLLNPTDPELTLQLAQPVDHLARRGRVLRYPEDVFLMYVILEGRRPTFRDHSVNLRS